MIRRKTTILVAVLGLLAGSAAAQVRSATVQVKGMSCPFCAFGVEKKLGRVPGVAKVEVGMKQGVARLEAGKDASIDVRELPRAVREAGFTPGAVTVVALGTIHRKDGTMHLFLPGGGVPFEIDAATEAARSALAAAADGRPVSVRGTVEVLAGGGVRLHVTAVRERR